MGRRIPSTSTIRATWLNGPHATTTEERLAEFDDWLDALVRRKQADVLRGTALGMADAQEEVGAPIFAAAIDVLGRTADRIESGKQA